MAAQSFRRKGLTGLLLSVALAGAAHAQDTTYLSGNELAEKLRQNLVWITAKDIDEHGYGLVVGGDSESLWVATARHVIVHTGMRGGASAEAPSRQIHMRLCGMQGATAVAGQPEAGFDAGGHDVAVLRMPRPRGYEPVLRAIASESAPALGEPVWLIGSNEECGVVPAQGYLRSAADAGHNLRIDFAGVQGGSSGAPVATAYGIIGLMKSVDDVITRAHDVADLQRRLHATPGVRWELVAARNIPPGDPQAAQIDLAETLDQYYLALRNVHMLLQLDQVQRLQLTRFVERYNAAVNRFTRVKTSHDGSLIRSWPAPVLPAWQGMRDKLWRVHLNFWRINPRMGQIFQEQSSPPDVREHMRALEPELDQLEKDIAQFLRMLAKEP